MAIPFPFEEARRTVDAVNQALRMGYRPPHVLGKGEGAFQQAAQLLGIDRRTIYGRLKAAETRYEIAPDWSLWTPPELRIVEELTPAKPRIRVRATTNETPPEGHRYRVIAIGDVHQKPGRSVERFKWMGRLIAERAPDHVVQIGDWATLDSMSMHDAPGSRRSNERPSFVDDLECIEESLYTLHREFEPGSIPCTMTEGNHEYRAQRAADADPKRLGDAMIRVRQPFGRYRWSTLEYRQWFFLGGVGFCHHPTNGMGKDYRGKNPENVIANDAMFSMVFGHTHKSKYLTVPKIGPQKRIEIVNLGTALPYGVVEDYAQLSTTGWDWGVFELIIQGGHIVSHRYFGMTEIEDLYGD